MNRRKTSVPETSLEVGQYLPESVDLPLQATFLVHGEHELPNLAVLDSKMNIRPKGRDSLII